MPNERAQHYDSFVIRIWQEAGTGRLLRAEVDHVQSGAVHIGRNTGLDWIQHTLQTVMGRDGESECGEADPPAPAPKDWG
jgi:hypothetical protein